MKVDQDLSDNENLNNRQSLLRYDDEIYVDQDNRKS